MNIRNIVLMNFRIIHIYLELLSLFIFYILCFTAYFFYTACTRGKYISIEENLLTIAGVVICVVLTKIDAFFIRKNKK